MYGIADCDVRITRSFMSSESVIDTPKLSLIFKTHLDQQQRKGWYSWETLEAETEAREGVYPVVDQCT